MKVDEGKKVDVLTKPVIAPCWVPLQAEHLKGGEIGYIDDTVTLWEKNKNGWEPVKID